ncbi:MAG TPA: phosphate signaling complex protein PhoU [Burkholderiales bacterium]|nr:phosphate signaling complex protein PhoU [Burkholderiales bacterium]
MSYEKLTTTTEVELDNLKYRLLAMGELVERQVRDAVRALVGAEHNLAETVVSREAEVNAMEIELDNQCTELIALRQPEAGDLRRVLTASKVVSNLEQIGDHAKKVARYAIAIGEANVVQARKLTDIEILADQSLAALRDALTAYCHLNAQAAQAVIDRDPAHDDRSQTVARQVLSYAMEDPRLITWALLAAAAAKAIERVGHQATKIAEHTIYAAEARDVRHRSKQGSPQPAAAS